MRVSRVFCRCIALALLLSAACGAPRTPEPARGELARAAGELRAIEPRGLPAHDARPGVAIGVHGAVASAEEHASRAGLDVLQRGGNAVDAAIAIAFALAVTHPSAGNVGGGGFMLVRMNDARSVAIDYREVAPRAATRDMYLDAAGQPGRDSVVGPRAAGIPGTVAGLALAHERFGTRLWSELVAPAIVLARDGHTLDASHADTMKLAATRMREAGFAASARNYLSERGAPVAQGTLWKQPELARTLQHIAEHGSRGFYTGPFADALTAEVRRLGGLWTSEDLANYRAVARAPISFPYRGREILSMPPPSAGGIVLRQILFGAEAMRAHEHPYRSPEAMHLYLEAARRAYADRNAWLADPDFVAVPVTQLLSPAYLQLRMQTINLARATPSSVIAPGTPSELAHESPETTHFSVVDNAGNAVSNTYTLNNGFGALVVVPGTGILLNDEMDDFASAPGTPNLYGLVQGEQNAIAPSKRMLSSMTPTIAVEDGALRAVLGTPGGPTITTTVAQLLIAMFDYGKPLDQAVRAPRLHHQWLPDQVTTDPGVEMRLADGLRARGHTLQVTSWGVIGHADCIEVDPQTHGYRAVADVTRGGGSALAY